LISQGIGSIFTVGLLLFFPGSGAVGPALAWGSIAGLGGGGGVLLLYRGLAIGRMSVVAPITGVEAAVVPVLFGLLTGERPSLSALFGVALALVAVVLVSSAASSTEEGERRAGLLEALGAGVAFGIFFIALDRAGSDTGVWPLIGARISSIGLVALVALVGRVKLRPPPGSMRPIAAAGLLDTMANVFYLVAVRQGFLSLVAVLTSMYPAATVALARVVLKERLTPIQLVGIALALVAVILIGLG
jgi:drug/metabolite transporter (DMT)-like permease